MKHLVVKTIKHKGIGVGVKIDFSEKEISIVDISGKSHVQGYPHKTWIFAGRTIEYMDSWVGILNAIVFAVKEAKKELQEYLDEEDRERAKLEVEINKAERKRG